MKQFKLEIYSSLKGLSYVFTYRILNESKTEEMYITSIKRNYIQEFVHQNHIEKLFPRIFNFTIIRININKKQKYWSTITISDEELFFFKLRYLDKTIEIDYETI